MTANPPTRLARLRERTRSVLAAYDEATLRRQAHPDLSPLLWHVGHMFFVENYWLAERVFGDTTVTDPWRTLYFPELCTKGERSARLPGPTEMRAWTQDIAAINDGYWARAEHTRHPLLDNGYLLSFVRQHYAQHLETVRMAEAQLALAASPSTPPIVARALDTRFESLAGASVTLGTDHVDAYDNEQPVQTIALAAFAIADAPVTNGQWLAFMNAGGYDDPTLWDPAGWAWRCEHGIDRPQHWQAASTGWRVNDLAGRIGTTSDDPVHGIGWYEARAFAAWAGARLPREAEWEAARRRNRLAATGQVWEWCDDAFAAYAGFSPFPYDEYSLPWFDGAHFVARGASRHTEADVIRPGFRNFYPPTHRHVFAGLRLARDTR